VDRIQQGSPAAVLVGLDEAIGTVEVSGCAVSFLRNISLLDMTQNRDTPRTLTRIAVRALALALLLDGVGRARGYSS
jgi:hypothetical protein